MKLSTDTQQKIMTAFLMCIEFYKILMGSFLIIFVPQMCSKDDTDVKEVCSMSDNISSDDQLKQVALYTNGLTFLTFVFLYVVEMKRENWCIEYLDIDESKPNNNLDSEIEEYPNIKKEMSSINLTYFRLVLVTCFMSMCNSIYSISVIVLDHNNAPTFTSLMSFLLFLGIKLFWSLSIAWSSLHEERAFSAYLTINRTYNKIDEDYAKQEKPLQVSL